MNREERSAMWSIPNPRVIPESSVSHPRVIPESSKSHQRVIKESSKSHQKVIRHSSDNHQTVIPTYALSIEWSQDTSEHCTVLQCVIIIEMECHPSFIHQKVITQSSGSPGSHQTVIRQPSISHQTVILTHLILSSLNYTVHYTT